MNEQPTAGAGEMAAVHILCGAMMTIFFRWQGSQDNFWHAGDESIVANGFTALVDMLYWLLKPRIHRWRDQQ